MEKGPQGVLKAFWRNGQPLTVVPWFFLEANENQESTFNYLF